jgi:putative RecB family exonuclease
MAKRVESPSSINTFKQCPRKYYYNYIEKIPTGTNIHCVRGNIVHSALENFYDLDLEYFEEDSFETQFKIGIQRMLMEQWAAYKEELDKLDMSKLELRQYFEESIMMLLNWSDHFLKEFSEELPKHNNSLQETFKALTPQRELEYRSEKHSIRGFIDAIHEKNGEIHIVDYKTNKKPELKASIKLQLAIYAMLYKEKHGVLPKKVGAFFVRDTLKMIEANDFMVENAIAEIEAIHEHTSKTEDKNDYYRKTSPLCKWKTGQCDFYDVCKPFPNRRY